jgi:Fungal Zn(2)-Cys(6) binuclear cluster domain
MCRNAHLYKCDSQRPECSRCRHLDLACDYALPEGVPTRQAYKHKLGDLEQSNSSLIRLLQLLRQGSDANAADALKRVREAESMEDVINIISGAHILMPVSSSATPASLLDTVSSSPANSLNSSMSTPGTSQPPTRPIMSPLSVSRMFEP